MTGRSRGELALLVATDVVSIVAAFALAFLLRFRYGVLVVQGVDAPPAETYAQALILILAVFIVVFHGRGLYRVSPARGFDVLEQTARATTYCTVLLLAAGYFYREFSYSRSVALMAWAILLVVVPIPRVTLLLQKRRRHAQGIGLRRVLLIGPSWAVDLVAQRLREQSRFGFDVIGSLRTEPSQEVVPGGPTMLGTLADLERMVDRHRITGILVAGRLERLELLDLLERADRLGVDASFVPNIYDLFVTPEDLQELHGVAFISLGEESQDRPSLALKRLFDLAIASALLVLTAPLIGLLVLLIRMQSPGPGLFAQRRVGQDGQAFLMRKLRSMVPDAEARLPDIVDVGALDQPVYKLDEDPRVFPLGRFLRRWSLDELPQLWNVVRGEMSLVGPRPEAEEVVARYDAHQRRRLKAKPGMTGLQQVHARATLDLEERIRLDVYYIRRRTFLFDLYILARTPWAVVSGHGAF